MEKGENLFGFNFSEALKTPKGKAVGKTVLAYFISVVFAVIFGLSFLGSFKLEVPMLSLDGRTGLDFSDTGATIEVPVTALDVLDAAFAKKLSMEQAIEGLYYQIILDDVIVYSQSGAVVGLDSEKLVQSLANFNALKLAFNSTMQAMMPATMNFQLVLYCIGAVLSLLVPFALMFIAFIKATKLLYLTVKKDYDAVFASKSRAGLGFVIMAATVLFCRLLFGELAGTGAVSVLIISAAFVALFAMISLFKKDPADVKGAFKSSVLTAAAVVGALLLCFTAALPMLNLEAFTFTSGMGDVLIPSSSTVTEFNGWGFGALLDVIKNKPLDYSLLSFAEAHSAGMINPYSIFFIKETYNGFSGLGIALGVITFIMFIAFTVSVAGFFMLSAAALTGDTCAKKRKAAFILSIVQFAAMFVLLALSIVHIACANYILSNIAADGETLSYLPEELYNFSIGAWLIISFIISAAVFAATLISKLVSKKPATAPAQPQPVEQTNS